MTYEQRKVQLNDFISIIESNTINKIKLRMEEYIIRYKPAVQVSKRNK